MTKFRKGIEFNMQILSNEQCYHLMCEMKMMDHIAVHSIQVCRVATFFANQLERQQKQLNYNLIQAAALLHDITKTRSFTTQENHAVTGGQFLAEKGFPEIGELVRQHVRLDDYPNPVKLGEAEIINYADKRVLHDEIVNLDKRLEYILERYAQKTEDRERIRFLWQKTKKLENAIFKNLSFTPEDLIKLIGSQGYFAEYREYQKMAVQF